MEDLTKHYLISGRVQGVGFRAFTRELARALNVRGWVRNLGDGRVEALVQGRPETMENFEALLSDGPPHGNVTDVKSRVIANATHLAAFELRPDGFKEWTES